MKSSDWALIIVALISVVSAMLASRSSRKAAKYESDAEITNSRTIAETEAYNRARKMDLETIKRQDDEIDEIREQNRKLRERIRELQEDNYSLREQNRNLLQRVTRLERHQEENSE